MKTSELTGPSPLCSTLLEMFVKWEGGLVTLRSSKNEMKKGYTHQLDVGAQPQKELEGRVVLHVPF
jgi:hypothetical protein